MVVYSDNGMLSVKLNIRGNLGMIVGNSGSGKTYLGNWLSMLYNGGVLKFSEPDITYTCVTDYTHLKGLISLTNKHLIFIDKLEQWGDDKLEEAERLLIPTLMKNN